MAKINMAVMAGDPLSSLDKNVRPKGSASLAAVMSAFVPTWVTGLAFVAIFILIRRHYPKTYYPRTYVGTIPARHRTPPADSYFGWVRTMYHTSDKFILYHQSLDAYLFLRFLRTIIFLCFCGCCLTWLILMPVNANGGGSLTDLDKIGIGNVTNASYYYAHAITAWILSVFVMFVILRERLWLISMRQAWAHLRNHESKLSSRTVLFLSAPKDALEEGNMTRIFGDAAVRVWPACKATALRELVSERDSKLEQLELAETTFIQNAYKRIRKEKNKDSRNGPEVSNYDDLPQGVRERIRPKRRLGHGITGDEVDSIRWLRERIMNIESQIQDTRAKQSGIEAGSSGAVFVAFKTITDAQKASQQVLSPTVLALTPRYPGISPKEVIWDNVFLTPERRASQEAIATALVMGLILFWSIPSGLIGLVSNISYLADSAEWLAWLKALPDPVIGLLSGLLPPLATSLLSKYVPNIFRWIFRSFGSATTVSNELKVQRWFYIFQVTQVFLVTAVFSGTATVFSQLLSHAKNPESIPSLLARELPKSSNYYITYFLIQGVTTSADNLLNWSDLLQYLALGWLFDKTPRQKFKRYTSMKGISWGKVFPKYANFAIIAISYACIAPLVLGFATIGLCLYYLSYRYNLLFVIQPSIDTQGRAYTLALEQLLPGLYIAELALIGLFGLASARGPLIIVMILFLTTTIYHYLTNKYVVPLEKHLPPKVALEELEEGETAPLLGSAEEGQLSGQRTSNMEAHIPAGILDSLEHFFKPSKFATYQIALRWLRDDTDFQVFEDEEPQRSEEQLSKAYKNPLLTSAASIVWLPRDTAGVSSSEVLENEKAGLKSTDKGAWLDESGNVCWDNKEFKEVPLLKHNPS